ncbi:MAG: FG-GAP-like repeat-containing protein, partial [Limisphaerales bacterium]
GRSLLVLLFLGFGVGLQGEELPTAGTKKMAALLARLRNEANPTNHPFLNQKRAEMFASEIALEKSRPEVVMARLVNLHGRRGMELLDAGRSAEAIEELGRALSIHRSPTGAHFFGSRDESRLRTALAVAYLRLGEQENCVSNHTTLSCILPIDKSATHRFPRGSRSAIKLLLEQLASRPNDLQARWLLNIAYMTLGEYPQKVPAAYLIPANVFKSEYDIGKFNDVAPDLGIDVADLSGGCITEDFDNDGYLDIVASSLGLDHQLRFFRNNGDGSFSDWTEKAGLIGEVGGLNIMQTDYDNDGWADIFVLRGGWFGSEGKHPKSLLRNRGDGTFDDVTEAAGLMSFAPTQTATWFDFNGDGWLDVFIGHESREGDTNLCQIFRNNRNGTFTECAQESGAAIVGWVKGVTSGDYNNDGRPDLYVSRLGEPNILLRNDGPNGTKDGWKFTDVSLEAKVTEPRFSFPTWFFDYDNDGWLDIFTGGYRGVDAGDVAADYLGLPHDAERPRLYRNLGNGQFKDVTKEAGLYRMLLAMGSNFGDLDNDGWLDFYLGTGEPDLAALMPNRMFRNADGNRFQDVTTSGGFGHLQKGHGIAFADLDHDGDQDIYQVMGGAVEGDTYRNVLFQNPGHGNSWVKLKLHGVRANRAAIGARLKLTFLDGGQKREVHRVVGSGGSFGASSLRQEIGLGKADQIEELVIDWPGSGTRQVFRGVPARVVITITEDQKKFAVTKQQFVPFRTGGKHQHHAH